MGKSMQPLLKRCKALGINPAVMGYTKESKRKGKEVRKKKSGYGLQLAEKQKVRFIYGLLEKQFKLTFEKANRMKGKTGENLIVLLERRLDNMVFRFRFAKTRKQARQLVNHGHILVNGEKVTIPSYLVKAGDVIEIKEGSKRLRIVGTGAASDHQRILLSPLRSMQRDAGKFKNLENIRITHLILKSDPQKIEGMDRIL